MTLAFLDLATRCGWCVGAGAVTPRVGHFKLPATRDDLGAWGIALWDALDELDLTASGIKRMGYEAPILPVGGGKRGRGPVMGSVLQRRKQMAAGVIVEMWARRRGIPCVEASVADLKRELTGKAQAEKADMVAAARRLGVEVAVHDEADALAGWLIMVRHYAKPHREAWDKRMWEAGWSGR